MSNEFKGTHGPWSAVQKYVDEVSVIDGNGFKVVTAERTAVLMDWDQKGFEHWGDEGGSRHLSGPEQFANSYLIAAAPEMLSLLLKIRDKIDKSDEWWMDSPDRGGFDTEEIDLLISKALGKS